jgi:hypothetical protein
VRRMMFAEKMKCLAGWPAKVTRTRHVHSPAAANDSALTVGLDGWLRGHPNRMAAKQIVNFDKTLPIKPIEIGRAFDLTLCELNSQDRGAP